MIWLITATILIIWLPIYFNVYYQCKASIAPVYIMIVEGPCLAVGPTLVLAVISLWLPVPEWEVITPIAVSFLVPLLVMLVHYMWDTRSGRKNTTNRCMNVFGFGYYDDKTLGSFTKWLVNSNVAAVVDVRADPVNTNDEFTQDNLVQMLSEYGIHYAHLSALCNPKDNQDDLHTQYMPAFYGARERYKEIIDGKMAQPSISYVRTLAKSVYDAKVVLLYPNRESFSHDEVLLRKILKGEKKF